MIRIQYRFYKLPPGDALVAHDSINKGRVRQIWHRNRGYEVSEIHEKCEADPIIGSDCPSTKTNGRWIKKEFKPNYRPLGIEKETACRWSQEVSAMGKLSDAEKGNLSTPEARI